MTIYDDSDNENLIRVLILMLGIMGTFTGTLMLLVIKYFLKINELGIVNGFLTLSLIGSILCFLSCVFMYWARFIRKIKIKS